jgi:hypothetical protein
VSASWWVCLWRLPRAAITASSWSFFAVPRCRLGVGASTTRYPAWVRIPASWAPYDRVPSILTNTWLRSPPVACVVRRVIQSAARSRPLVWVGNSVSSTTPPVRVSMMA